MIQAVVILGIAGLLVQALCLAFLMDLHSITAKGASDRALIAQQHAEQMEDDDEPGPGRC